jgi:hypothetical protein
MRCPLFAGPLRQATKQPIYARKVYVFADFGRMLFPNCNTLSLSKTSNSGAIPSPACGVSESVYALGRSDRAR